MSDLVDKHDEVAPASQEADMSIVSTPLVASVPLPECGGLDTTAGPVDTDTQSAPITTDLANEMQDPRQVAVEPEYFSPVELPITSPSIGDDLPANTLLPTTPCLESGEASTSADVYAPLPVRTGINVCWKWDKERFCPDGPHKCQEAHIPKGARGDRNRFFEDDEKNFWDKPQGGKIVFSRSQYPSHVNIAATRPGPPRHSRQHVESRVSVADVAQNNPLGHTDAQLNGGYTHTRPVGQGRNNKPRRRGRGRI